MVESIVAKTVEYIYIMHARLKAGRIPTKWLLPLILFAHHLEIEQVAHRPGSGSSMNQANPRQVLRSPGPGPRYRLSCSPALLWNSSQTEAKKCLIGTRRAIHKAQNDIAHWNGLNN